HDPAPGPPDVAEQQLEDRRGADVLHADRVLGPADRVTERRGAVTTGVLRQRPGHSEEVVDGHTAGALHHLGRVPAEVPFEDLEDAAGVLQRVVPRRGGCGRGRPGATRSGDLGGILFGAVIGTAALVRSLVARALVLPRVDLVLVALVIEAREHPGQVLGVEELLV